MPRVFYILLKIMKIWYVVVSIVVSMPLFFDKVNCVSLENPTDEYGDYYIDQYVEQYQEEEDENANQENIIHERNKAEINLGNYANNGPVAYSPPEIFYTLPQCIGVFCEQIKPTEYSKEKKDTSSSLELEQYRDNNQYGDAEVSDEAPHDYEADADDKVKKAVQAINNRNRVLFRNNIYSSEYNSYDDNIEDNYDIRRHKSNIWRK